MALCSMCKQRHAIVFTTRYENGKRIDEGFCVKCAYKARISGITDMFKDAGIDENNIDELSDRIEETMGNNDFGDPSALLSGLMNGSLDAPYDFDEDSTNLGVADEQVDGPEDEQNNGNPLGNIFNRMFGMGGPKGEEEDAKNPNAKKDKKRNNTRMKYLNEFGTNLTERAAQGKIDRIIGRDVEIDRCIQILR